MAIYKPTDCSPFNGTFDLSSDLPIIFECKIDTSNSPVTGYSIEIYNSNNEIIFPGVNRTIGPIKSNVTYLTDLKEYVKDKFPSLVSNIRNVNSGLNGTVLEIPAIVNSSDVDNDTTVGRNQIGIVSGETNILVDGQTYTWKITLYQEVENGTKKTFPPAEEKFYDMTVASGTVIGSNEKRIQTALIDSDDKVVDNLVLIDKFVQPIKIDGLNDYDPSNPVTGWTGTVPTEFTMTRSLITDYDSTYGYVYPSTAEENAFADGQIVPENANGFQIFKNGNNPSNLGATDMVEFIYDSGEFNGKMTWKTSAAKPEQSYWEQVYLVGGNPGGTFYPLKGDGYNSFALTGSERIVFNNIQDSKVQYDEIYYGSPYNGIFEPHFSSKEILTNNKTSSGTYMLPAGTYTFKQTPSLGEFTGEQVLNFSTTKSNGVILEWTKIRVTTNSILYTSKSNSKESLVFFFGITPIDNTETITLKTDQEVSADFLMWFSQNVDITFYQVTAVWQRTTDAANWGTLSNKIIYCRRDGKNYEINTATQAGEINKTPFKFVEEKPVRIFNTAEVTTDNAIRGDDSKSNPRISHTSRAISSILSVTNNNGVDVTKDCAFEVGKNYIIYTSSSAIPSDLTISVKYIPFNIHDYTGIIFYNKQSTPDSGTGIIYIRPSININKSMIFKEITTTANPTWFNISYFNKDYNYITYTGHQGFNPEIDKTRYQIKSFYKDSNYNPFSIYKNPEITSYLIINGKQQEEALKINGETNYVGARNFSVVAEYVQNSYISWKNYQWILYDAKKRAILEKTDEKYSGEITGTFYGLERNTSYILSLVLQTNIGKIIEIDYVLQTNFEESGTKPNIVAADFDCDTLAMKATVNLENTIIAPEANQYLSSTKNGTTYYYDKSVDFYTKNGSGIASVDNGILTITGKNSLDFQRSFAGYNISDSTQSADIQINSDQIVVEGSFSFSKDYQGDIFSLTNDGTEASVKINVPAALENIGSDGLVKLSDDIDKIGANGSYLKIYREGSEDGKSGFEWQNASDFHNTSIWKEDNKDWSFGNRINVANFKYAEVEEENNGIKTYLKNTYLNINAPYNSYDGIKPLKNPMNPGKQSVKFSVQDQGDYIVDGSPFQINEPDRLIWLDYTPAKSQKAVVVNANSVDGVTTVTTQPMTVMKDEPLKWNDDSTWKDGIYVKSGFPKTLIGQISINGVVVQTDYLKAIEPITYSNSGLTKQKQVDEKISERNTISNYNFAFRIFINTNTFSVDTINSYCYVTKKS